MFGFAFVCRARKVAQHFTFGASREGGACLCPRIRYMVRNGLCACFLPLCQRCFPQAPQIGGGDSGEELEDNSQEPASSETEPEEPAGPADINAVGNQHVVRACFLPDCLVCSGACAGQVMTGESSSQGLPRRGEIIGKAAQHPSPLFAWWHLYIMSCTACWMQLPQTRFSLVARAG